MFLSGGGWFEKDEDFLLKEPALEGALGTRCESFSNSMMFTVS